MDKNAPVEWNVLDLFSGIGGFAYGIQSAGVKIKNHYFSEIEKNAIKVYQNHFNKAENLGDVSTIRDVSRLGSIDIITFGFPCQDLSLAGKRAGLDGSRSGLFFEAMRLVKELRPTYFIFENVKGLLTSHGGADFIRCLREIADIGLYDCEWQLVNTSWVLPQNRERVYFVGHFRGKSQPKVFPFTESDFENTDLQRQQVCTLTTRSNIADGNGSYIVERELHEKTRGNSQGQRVNTTDGNSVTLSAHGDGMGAKTGLYVVPRGNNDGGFRDVDNCPTITTSRFEQNNFVCIGSTQKNAATFENLSPTLTSAMGMGGGHVPMIYPKGGYLIRRLTPRECAKLQGFPEDWCDGLSDSAQYKCYGNAVTTTIPKMIVERLIA